MKTKCQDLSIDLMHFSTDEFKEVKDIAGLKAHLKRCPDCRKHLKGLREVHLLSVLSRPRSASYREKMGSLIKRVRAESAAHKNNRKNGTLPARTGEE